MNLSFCSFASGSSGNCYLIKSRESAILIDAGISTKKIHAALEELGTERSEISGVFVTHEHSDHVKGLQGSDETESPLERLCQRRNLSLSSGDRT